MVTLHNNNGDDGNGDPDCHFCLRFSLLADIVRLINSHIIIISTFVCLTSTWPHLNSDVGLEEGEY